MKQLLALAAIAAVVPMFAMWNQFNIIDVPALAEDDCDYYHHQFYVLDEVIGKGGYVVCRYRADTFLF